MISQEYLNTQIFISLWALHLHLPLLWGHATERWVVLGWPACQSSDAVQSLNCLVLEKPSQWRHSCQSYHNPALSPQLVLSVDKKIRLVRNGHNIAQKLGKLWFKLNDNKKKWYLNLFRWNFEAKRFIVIRVQCVFLYCCFLLFQPFTILHQVDLHIRVWKTFVLFMNYYEGKHWILIYFNIKIMI